MIVKPARGKLRKLLGFGSTSLPTTGSAAVEEFLSAGSAASFCEEISDEAIVLPDGGDDSSCSDEIDSGPSLTPTPMFTQRALLPIVSLIDFVHAEGLP